LSSEILISVFSPICARTRPSQTRRSAMARYSARDRSLPVGFIPPCQPVLNDRVPASPDWLHELKHDGWRIFSRKSGPRVRIWTRHGKKSASFVATANALRFLPVTACVLDGEAVAYTADGWPDFYGLRSSAGAVRAVLFAFDLPELDAVDM
jgi:bifunctional non-homologous end joining protein LigD